MAPFSLVVINFRKGKGLTDRTKLLINRDHLMNADKATVAKATVDIYDRIQGKTPEAQILATAAAFVLLCEEAGVELGDAYTATLNLMVDPLHRTRRDARFAAMSMYLRDDVLGTGRNDIQRYITHDGT